MKVYAEGTRYGERRVTQSARRVSQSDERETRCDFGDWPSPLHVYDTLLPDDEVK